MLSAKALSFAAVVLTAPVPRTDAETLAELLRWTEAPPDGCFQVEMKTWRTWPSNEDLVAAIAHARELVGRCSVAEGRRNGGAALDSATYYPALLAREDPQHSLRRPSFDRSIRMSIDGVYWWHRRTWTDPAAGTFTTIQIYDRGGRSAQELHDGVLQSQTLLPAGTALERSDAPLTDFLQARILVRTFVELLEEDGGTAVTDGESLRFRVDLSSRDRCRRLVWPPLLPGPFIRYPGHVDLSFAVKRPAAELVLLWRDCDDKLVHRMALHWADERTFPSVERIDYVPGVEQPLRTTTFGTMRLEGASWREESFAFRPAPGTTVTDERTGQEIVYEVGPDGSVLDSGELRARVEGALLDAVHRPVARPPRPAREERSRTTRWIPLVLGSAATLALAWGAWVKAPRGRRRP